MDLSQFFGRGMHDWPDALTSETRRHLAGCLASIETAFAVAARDNAIGRLLTLIDGPIVWPAVQRHPHILSPEVLAHMRLRAAVGLLGGQAVRGDGDAAAEPAQGSGWLIGDDDPALVEIAAALALAEARWSSSGNASASVPADLPAENFAELVWTGAALLGTALHSGGLAERHVAMAAMTEAAYSMLARHQEEAGGFALAIRLARILRDRGRHAELLGQALAERRYLLFAALAGELADVEMEAVLDVLVHGGDAQLAALCRALGGTASDYRHLLMDLRVVRGERDDPALVRLAQNYDALQDDDVAAETVALRLPAALRAKLAMIPAVEQG